MTRWIFGPSPASWRPRLPSSPSSDICCGAGAAARPQSRRMTAMAHDEALIQVVARAICRNVYRNTVFRAAVESGQMPEAAIDGYVDINWENHRGSAVAAIEAVEQYGLPAQRDPVIHVE